MKGFIVSILVLGVVTSGLGKKSSSSGSGSTSSGAYSQPIVPSYGAAPAPVPAPHPHHTHPGRHDAYSYSQPMVSAASSQTEYYQPMDQGYAPPTSYGTSGGGVAPTPVYARHAAPVPTGYYEPVPAAGHHHSHYPVKRGWGWGGGGGGGHGDIGHLAVLIPLIIIPLLLCWPWFIYAASHHHHPVVYAAPGWKRSSDGKVPIVDKKVEELTEKVLPKLSKE